MRGCPWGIYGGDRVCVANGFIGKRDTLWSMMYERLQKDPLRADNSISRVMDEHRRTAYMVGIYNRRVLKFCSEASFVNLENNGKL
jgi:hypothetical protein